MKNNILNKKEKTKKWNLFLNKLNYISDSLGMPIDEKIKELVVAMNLFGLRTEGSCQGHPNKRLLFPYIYCKISGEPKYQYRREKQIKKKLMQKYHIKNNKMLHSDSDSSNKFWDEYVKIIFKLKYLNKYVKWAKKNEPLGKKIFALINEFNKKKTLSKNNKLRLIRIYPGYRIVSSVDTDTKKISNEAKKNLIILSQKTFGDFTKFLKNKYFKSA